jgi:hypothetical protein
VSEPEYHHHPFPLPHSSSARSQNSTGPLTKHFLFTVLLKTLYLYGILYKGTTNALVCIKTLIQMSHTETFQITPTCFDHQMIIIRELSDPG